MTFCDDLTRSLHDFPDDLTFKPTISHDFHDFDDLRPHERRNVEACIVDLECENDVEIPVFSLYLLNGSSSTYLSLQKPERDSARRARKATYQEPTSMMTKTLTMVAFTVEGSRGKTL